MKTKDQIKAQCQRIQDMLIAKNQAYGDSAINPVRIFSSADPAEQIKVRIDDKLSRLSRGNEYPGGDTIDDLIGYLVLLKIAKENADKPSISDSPEPPDNELHFREKLTAYLLTTGWTCAKTDDSDLWWAPNGVEGLRIDKDLMTINQLKDTLTKIASDEGMSYEMLIKRIQLHASEPGELRTA